MLYFDQSLRFPHIYFRKNMFKNDLAVKNRLIFSFGINVNEFTKYVIGKII